MKRHTSLSIKQMKGAAPIVALTAYTYNMAQFLDPSVDLLLVGDSVGMILYGFNSTLGVSVDIMVHHASAVVKGSKRALVVVDMPFSSYESSPQHAFKNASHMLSQTGAGAVKLEGHAVMAETVDFLVQRGIPVMGHIGLRPQHINTMGGFVTQGKDQAMYDEIIHSAKKLEQAGCFAMVLEGVPAELAVAVTKEISIPTIGIGASPDCDGQILVTEDILGLFSDFTPSFAKQYSNLGNTIKASVQQYADQVRNRTFKV